MKKNVGGHRQTSHQSPMRGPLRSTPGKAEHGAVPSIRRLTLHLEYYRTVGKNRVFRIVSLGRKYVEKFFLSPTKETGYLYTCYLDKDYVPRSLSSLGFKFESHCLTEGVRSDAWTVNRVVPCR